MERGPYETSPFTKVKVLVRRRAPGKFRAKTLQTMEMAGLKMASKSSWEGTMRRVDAQNFRSKLRMADETILVSYRKPRDRSH